MSFATLGLTEPILRALVDIGYTSPTPIQLQAIPAILAGQDLIAGAQTGTGKTASFTLPLLQRLARGPKVKSNQVRALVLTPTRELAVQVGDSVARYGKHLSLRSGVIYGGVKINPQMMKLRGGLDVLVATPGRLLDLHHQNAVKFAQLEILVLDEADRMLDLGFLEEINKILSLLPKRRQTLLFSATLCAAIRQFGEGLLKRPLQLDVSPPNAPAESVKQWVYEVDKGKKSALLSHLLRSRHWEQVLVFISTKTGADRLVQKLVQEGVSAAAIHGDKRQGERSRALAEFNARKLRVLVATDLASRGIDIRELPQVINFELPKVPADYIHRIGRTGRAGAPGEAISLVSADEVALLEGVESLIGQTLLREVEGNFIPALKVPVTQLRKMKPKKLKQKVEQAEGEERKS